MFTLLRQENRKLMHHRVIQLFIPFIMIFQFIIAIYAAHYPQLLTPYDAFVNNDYGFIPLLFLAITKWLTILGLMIGLSGFSTLMSLGLKLSFFRRLPNYGTIWHTWGLNMLSTGLTLLFLMSVVLLLGTLFTSSTPAILTGIIGYFIVTIFNQLCFYLYAKVSWLKWNPLNMINLGEQIQTPQLQQLTRLNLSTLAIGYIAYLLLFLTLANYSFQTRNV